MSAEDDVTGADAPGERPGRDGSSDGRDVRRPQPPAEIHGVLEDELADIDTDRIEREERGAARRWSSIEAGRRKGGVAGAAIAGAMLALHEIYEGPLRDEIVAEVEAPGEPGDIDVDGIQVRVDDLEVWAPPPDPPVDDAS